MLEPVAEMVLVERIPQGFVLRIQFRGSRDEDLVFKDWNSLILLQLVVENLNFLLQLTAYSGIFIIANPVRLYPLVSSILL